MSGKELSSARLPRTQPALSEEKLAPFTQPRGNDFAKTEIGEKGNVKGAKDAIARSTTPEPEWSTASGVPHSQLAKMTGLGTLDLGDLDQPKPQHGSEQVTKNVGREKKIAENLKPNQIEDAVKQKLKGMGVEPQDEQVRQAAIEASGMVGSHAEAFSNVAVLRDEVILTRAVNLACTKLIEGGSATKNLHIKSKSSDWGPQSGLIPVDGKYSKLGNEENKGHFDTKKMDASSKASADAIEHGWAIPQDLEDKTKEGHVYGVPTTLDEDWKQKGLPTPESMHRDDERFQKGTHKPFQVLADPEAKAPIAADYDLFAIGSKKSAKDKPHVDAHMGQITDREKGTIMDLNAAVMGTGYEGGRVAHHGAETMNPYTDMDFPVTAFKPNGEIVSIKNQDELVEFFNKGNAEGYKLAPNERWTNEDPKAKEDGTYPWSRWAEDEGKFSIPDQKPIKGEVKA